MKCGLLGRKLGHSYSPRIHALLGDYSYELFEKEEEELEAFFADPDAFDAINVTIPYKQKAMEFCHHVSAEARAIGAVNTVVRRHGQLWGYNTDYHGFAALLDKTCTVRGKKVLVLGSGGASKPVCTAISNRGGCPVVISRSGENHYGNLDRHYADTAVIVNTTPVGMSPRCPDSPLSLTGFKALEAVVDIIYNPARTGLLLEAERLGIPCVNGLFMLVAQARTASELFCGSTLPAEMDARITAQIAAETENIILVGMPGSGKSTVAARLAEIMHRPHYDSDEQVLEQTGLTPEQLIRQRGEDAFRREETAALRQLCCRSGAVISCGGGVVTRRENIELLRQNGRVVWLRRPLECLATAGRPLSMGIGALEALYESRRGAYEAAADLAVDNTGTPEAAADTIRKLLYKKE